MAKYHGDLMYKVGTIHQAADDRNYPTAIALAFLFGAMGVHRFYLNDNRIASFYFFPFAITCLISMALLSFAPVGWYLLIASPLVLGEIAYFVHCWAKR